MQSSVVTKGNVFVGGERRSWQHIDRALRSIAKRRCALDAEEAVLLCAVVRREIWRQLDEQFQAHVAGVGDLVAADANRQDNDRPPEQTAAEQAFRDDLRLQTFILADRVRTSCAP